jgi:hypothetical protein
MTQLFSHFIGPMAVLTTWAERRLQGVEARLRLAIRKTRKVLTLGAYCKRSGTLKGPAAFSAPLTTAQLPSPKHSRLLTPQSIARPLSSSG